MEWIRPNLEYYDEEDPQTWPEGPAKDEALNLKAWVDWDNYGRDYEDLPDIPEKAEALALLKEHDEVTAWIEAQSIETIREYKDPEYIRHNERENEIDKRLNALDRLLKRKMPKNAERKLEKLIAAEAKEADREFRLFEESAA